MKDKEAVKPDNVVPFQTLSQRVAKIQAELVGEKGNKNSFGGYKYRNVEGILNEVKPLLMKHGLFMQMEDHLVEVGGSVYIEARVMVSDAGEFPDETDKQNIPIITSIAYAREPFDHKGMSPSQMTGTASSYARKYALGALFLLSGEACDDYISQVDSEVKELRDSLDRVQGKDKDKDKDKGEDKEIIIPKSVKKFGGRKLSELNLVELGDLNLLCTTPKWEKLIKDQIDSICNEDK